MIQKVTALRMVASPLNPLNSEMSSGVRHFHHLQWEWERKSTHATSTQSMEDREGQLQLKNAKWGLRMHSLLLSESFPPFSFSLFHTHFHFHWYIWERKISCCSNQQQLHWCPKNPLPLYNLSFLNISLCL